MSHEPGLRFWLRYVERAGGLVEDAGDHAVALLPDSLRRDGGLGEEIVVTSDPDTAGDEGAVLLIPGHPALERAAASVLEHGDAGRSYLEWPRSAPPRASELERDARERFHVEHGRIDAAGEPRPVYLPLLRVGAMVSYAASLTHSFQEQEEAWVDVRTGLGVPDETLGALAGQPCQPEPDTTRTALDAELAPALGAAHRLLEERAKARQEGLLVQARQAHVGELDRTDAYYRGALESIERRRQSAAPERALLLESQAQATRAEHERRRREIQEEFRATYEIRPFRLHMIFAPGYVVPVDVRRGPRSFPLELSLLCTARGRLFAELRCPHCAVGSGLVAGRERLGCRSCLGKPASGAADAHGGVVDRKGGWNRNGSDEVALASPEPRSHREPEPEGRPAERSDRRGPEPEGSPPARTVRGGPGPERMPPARTDRGGRRTKPPPSRRRSRGERAPGRSADRVPAVGGKLATSFWETVVSRERWHKRKVVRDSPLGALYRLYGAEGPLRALGVAPGEWPTEVTARTLPHTPGHMELTHGELRAAGRSYPYALHWRLQDGKPLVGEVMPGPHPTILGPSSPGPTELEVETRLHELAPTPTVQLDPVAAALWRTELAETGLPFAVRCLATWWRVERSCPPHPTTAVAAAIAGAVATAAALRRPAAHASSTYAAAPEDVERAAVDLRPHLRLDRNRGW